MIDADALLDKLSPNVRTALETARDGAARFAAGTDKQGYAIAYNATLNAFDEVGIPRRSPGAFAPAADFTEAQRAVLLWSALHGLGVGGAYSVPGYPSTRLRWLGVDPGLLETMQVGGEPLWRALQQSHGKGGPEEILDALPNGVTLRVLEEIYVTGRAYGIAIEDERLRLFRELGDEGRDWAIALAGAFPRATIGASSPLALWVFLALARAKLPIEEAWEDLYPNFGAVSPSTLIECAAALSEERRAEVLKRHFPTWHWAIEMVAAFPAVPMAMALLDSAVPGSPRWSLLLGQLRELGRKHPLIGEAVERRAASVPAPIELFYSRSVRPKSAAELSALEREQLRIGTRGYDEQDLDADARFDGDDPSSETSVGDTLEIRTICDAAGVALYDAYSYFVDAGVIFRAGTTEEIGWLGQGGVVLKDKNEPLREALQRAIGRHGVPLRGRKGRAGATKKLRKR